MSRKQSGKGPAFFYEAFRIFIGLCLRVYYRRIEAPGLDAVPREGPLLLVANHGNALLDPLILLALLRRRVSFLAKHTLFEMPVIGFFTRAIGGLPVYRRQDAPRESSRNEETLDACRAILEGGGAVCLFPEGISHHRPKLVSLKSGAARILLRVPEEARGRVRVIPVGINFEAKRAFRSRVLVLFGPAVAGPGVEPAAAGEDVGGLTRRIEEALQRLVPGLDSWQELEFVRGIKDLYLGGRADSLAQEAPALRRFIDGYRGYREACPARVAEIRAGWEAHRRQLARFSVTEPQLDLADSPVRAARFLAGSALVMGLVLPLAAVGFVVHVVPYVMTGRLERRLNRQPDLSATMKLLIGLVLFPLTYLVVLAFPFARGGWRAALPGLVLLPLTGWAALLLAENRQRLAESAKALFIALPGGRPLDELRRERRELLGQVSRLIRERPPASAPPLENGAGRGER